MRNLMLSLCMAAAVLTYASESAFSGEQDHAPAGEQDKEVVLETSLEKLSYTIGMQIAQSLQASNLDLDIETLMLGLKDAYTGRRALLSDQEMMDVQRELMAQQEKDRSGLAESNLNKSRAFLAENRERDSVRVTESGLQYEILKSSDDGQRPGATDSVKVHYTGRTIDDDVFDSSHMRGEPAVFALNRVIPGFSEGIQMMREGDSYRFYIDPELGYGESGAGDAIGPNQALIFDVDLIEVME